MDFLADRCGEDTVLDVVPVEARGMEEVVVSRPRGRGSVRQVARKSAGAVAVQRLLGSAGWRRIGLRKSTSVLRWNKPSARSAFERKALSERMHSAKMAKVAARAVVAHAEDLQTIFSSDQVSCRTKVSIVKRKKCAALRVVFGGADVGKGDSSLGSRCPRSPSRRHPPWRVWPECMAAQRVPLLAFAMSLLLVLCRCRR